MAMKPHELQTIGAVVGRCTACAESSVRNDEECPKGAARSGSPETLYVCSTCLKARPRELKTIGSFVALPYFCDECGEPMVARADGWADCAWARPMAGVRKDDLALPEYNLESTPDGPRIVDGRTFGKR
jgi:hypothetical protein